jgi:uncharacterized membrane protein
VDVTRATYLTVLGGAALWCLLLAAAPLLAAAGPPAAAAGEFLYRFFHPICHQLEERSLSLAGHPLAVCSRCNAIYFAFLAGVLVFPLLRPLRREEGISRAWIAAALAPMLADVALGVIGVHEPGMATRLVTGGVFGFAIAFVVLPPGLQAVREIALQRRTRGGMSGA